MALIRSVEDGSGYDFSKGASNPYSVAPQTYDDPGNPNSDPSPGYSAPPVSHGTLPGSTAPPTNGFAPGYDYVNHSNPNIVAIDPRTGSTPAVNPQTGVATGTQIGSPSWIDQWLRTQSQMPGVNPSVGLDPNYWKGAFARDGGSITSANEAYWENLFRRPEGAPESWSPGNPNGTGGGYQGTNVFSDPATQQWEQLLNSLVGKLNTPYSPPGQDAMMAQLQHYFQQLQGPAYTPAQMNLIQTQSTDPLMQARDSARQQILQQFSQRGLTPDSPIVQSALEQSDQKYGVANTQAQAGFATNAIGLDRQNQATAAQIGPQIVAAQQGLYNYNLGNQLQGVNLANQIPTTAWNRLTGANSLIQPLNPSALLENQNRSAVTGYNQSNDYTSILMTLLAQLFGGK